MRGGSNFLTMCLFIQERYDPLLQIFNYVCVYEITNCIKCYDKKQIVQPLWYRLIRHWLCWRRRFPRMRVAGGQRASVAPMVSQTRASGPHLSPFTLFNMIWWAFREDRPGGKGQGSQVRCSRRGSDGTMLVCTGDSARTERHGRTQVREGRSVIWTWGWVRHGEQETGNKVFPEFVVCVGIWLQCHSRWTRTSLGGKIMILWLSFVGRDLPLLPASRWLLSYKTWFKTRLLKK